MQHDKAIEIDEKGEHEEEQIESPKSKQEKLEAELCKQKKGPLSPWDFKDIKPLPSFPQK